MGTALHHTVRDRIKIHIPTRSHFQLQPTPAGLGQPPPSANPAQNSPTRDESVFRSVRAGLEGSGGMVEGEAVEDWMHDEKGSVARHAAAIHILDEIWYGFIDLAEEAARRALKACHVARAPLFSVCDPSWP